MKLFSFLSVLLVSLCLFSSPTRVSGNNALCIACTAIVGLIEQTAMIEQWSIVHAVEQTCWSISGNKYVDMICDVLLNHYAPQIQKDYDNKITPDQSCRTTMKSLCKGAPQCTLFQPWPIPLVEKKEEYVPSITYIDYSKYSNVEPAAAHPYKGQEWVEKFSHIAKDDAGLSKIGQIFQTMLKAQTNTPSTTTLESKIASLALEMESATKVQGNIAKHFPLIDNDNDAFSIIEKLRGTDWRGKDCNDSDANVYPGRLINNEGPNIDHNCNGIVGVDPNTGISYEDEYCSNSGQIGILAIGDSATAHFGIPRQWFSAPLTNTSMRNTVSVLEDEGDWPGCSASTAHSNTNYTNCPSSLLPYTSIYQLLRDRNLCMHRDYQNLGVNGARSTNTAPPNGNIMSFVRHQKTDQPALVIYSLIGNDVCSGHKSFESMTSLDEFTRATWKSLMYLDTQLPPNSNVITIGLVDGRVLYDTVWNRIHPVGVTYEDFYDYLNCMNTSPCWGWMNNNSTVRNTTTAHAMLLNTAYQLIEQQQNFTNFKVTYYFANMPAIINQWQQEGHDPIELIEPVDGFHPSQTAQNLVANALMKFLISTIPEALGPINPNNQAIINRFGADLNGY